MNASSQLSMPPPPAAERLVQLREFLLVRAAASGLATELLIDIHPQATPPERCLWMDSAGGSSLALRLAPGASLLPAAVPALAAAWKDLHEAEKRELLLLEELAVDWESLQALYDLSADLQSDLSHSAMLRRILERATASVRDSSAILLLERSGGLVPIAWLNTPEPGHFSTTRGLIGRVVLEQHAIVLNDPARVRAAVDLEPSWADATSIALAPITTPQRGLFGIIALWSRNPESGFTSHLVRLLEALGQQAALIVESDRLGRTLRESERLTQEIQIGSLIQQTLLIGEPPRHHPYFDVASMNMPSQTVDGDFMDMFLRADDGLEILVGDVMGKGIPAALIGAATKGQVLRALADTGHAVATGAVTLDGIINRAAARMTPNLQAIDRFVTLNFALVDPHRNTVQWVDCGHTATLHYHGADGTTTQMKGEGLPMGVLESEVYTECSQAFEPGDTLLFYSDGVTEASNAEGEMFGEDRLAAVLVRHAPQGAAAILDAVRHCVVEFSGSGTFADDFTCLALRLLPPGERPIFTSSITLNSSLAELPRFYAWASRFFSSPEAVIDSDDSDLLLLALTEAITNIMRHGYQGQAGKPIEIYAAACPDQLVFEIEDEGFGWTFAAVPDPAFDGSKTGGFGLFIIDQVMDRRLQLRLPNGRNRLQLTRLRSHQKQNPTETKS